MNRRVETNKKPNPAGKCETTAADLIFIRILKIAAILMVVVLAWSGRRALYTYDQFRALEKVQHSILKTNGTISHLDEVLAMSAKMATATGDLRWEDRYRSFEPKLDAAIKKVMDISPGQFIYKAAAQTDLANTKLIAMENEAFDLVRKGNLNAASELLYSQEYEKQKHIYSRGMERCASALETYMEVESEKKGNTAIWLIILVDFSMLLAARSGLGILEMRRRLRERKRAEESIKLAYKELEQAHNELEETQLQLVQNEKLASIGQLAAGVAHEMNTPVGFVASNFQTLEGYVKKIRDLLTTYDELIGQIETLGKTELQNKIEGIGQSRDDLKIDFILEDISGLFAESRDGLERVTGIVQNLRDFSRVDQSGSRDEYNINKGIESTLVVVRNEIKYDADVRTEFSEVPPVFCHSGQINQVFLNALLNAAQAIKSQERDGNGTITIRTYASDDKVVCEIADDGPGIHPDNLSRIFDPFFTTKPAGKGTGLGLSVSYDIVVNKHNGEFFVESTVGEGTKFTMKLPIGMKENDEQEIMSDGKKNSIICGR